MTTPPITIPATVESTGGVQLAVHDLGGSGSPLLISRVRGVITDAELSK